MTAIKSNHSRVFEQLAAKYRVELLEALATGMTGPKDYAGYMQCVGRIQGLDDALKLSEEADYKLNGDDIDDS